MRKALSIFLILVFATTVLPIGQVGRLLASNQLNEEVCQQGNQLLEEKVKDCHFETCGMSIPISERFELSAMLESLRIQHKEDIPSSPSCDILVPPPNPSAV